MFRVLGMYNFGWGVKGDFLVQGSDCAGPSQAPNFFAFQLTLSQPGGAHHPHQVVRATPDFQTLRRPCGGGTFCLHFLNLHKIWKDESINLNSVP